MRALVVAVLLLVSRRAVAQVDALLPNVPVDPGCQPALLCQAGLIDPGPSAAAQAPTVVEFREEDGEAPQGELWSGVASVGALEEVVSVTQGLGSLISELHLGERLTLWSEAFVSTIQPHQPQLLQFGWLQAISLTLATNLFLDVGVDVGLPGTGQTLTSFVMLSFDPVHRSMIPSFLSTSCAFSSQSGVP
jgi:hypothetical protein